MNEARLEDCGMQTVLVTGGAGFIGSNFVHYLLGAEPQARVINLDALTYAGSLENLVDLPAPERHIFVQGDICDAGLVESLFQQYEIQVVVHFAAETHVDRSIVDPGAFVRTNIQGTYTLLEAARKAWSAAPQAPGRTFRFHHVSTDEVYGALKPGEPAFSETTPYAPNSPYAATKAASDHLVRAYGHTFGLPVTISNCSNNYGPRQYPEKLIPLMIANGLAGRPLPVYGDGQQVRDWLYVEDHCQAIWTVVRRGVPGETYNIGGGNQPPNLEVVETLCAILDEYQPAAPYCPHRSLIQFVADRPGHDRRYAIDMTRIQQELNWRPSHTLASGLVKTAAWYLANQGWVRKIQQQESYQQWLARNYSQRGDMK